MHLHNVLTYDSWLSKTAKEIQSFADRKGMNVCHDALQTVYVPQGSGCIKRPNADGMTLLMDKDDILERWSEHFNSMLNRPSTINENAINALPQKECNVLLVLLDEFPTVMKIKKALHHLTYLSRLTKQKEYQ